MVFIWNLPVDVLQRIFIHCCTSLDKPTATQACTYNLVVTGASIALPCQNILRHVSHQWRFVVEYSAVLWSNIRIIWPCEYRHAGLRVEILRYFVHYAILRSQTNELDIYIEDEGWEETARILLPQSHRWRSLVFARSAITVPTTADFRAMHCRIPRLQTFKFPVWTPDLDYNAFQKAFVDVPTLRVFECNLAMLTWGVRFPWTQIVDLSLVYSGSRIPGVGDRMFNKVMQSPNLRRLTISGLLPDTTGRDTVSIITAPHLQELSAKTPDWIPFFDLPALKTVSIDVADARALIELIDRSQCSLTSLSLSFRRTDDASVEAFKALLLRAYGVQTLNIAGASEVMHSILPILLRPLHSAKTMPLLAELGLEVEGSCSTNAETTSLLCLGVEILNNVIKSHPSLACIALGVKLARSTIDAAWTDKEEVLGLETFKQMRGFLDAQGAVLEVKVTVYNPHDTSRREVRVH